jgi:CSLREA domain-containing protein
MSFRSSSSEAAVGYEASWLGKASRRSALTLGLLAVVAVFLMMMMLFTAAKPAHAVSTFTVNTTLDTGDTTPDGVCDSSPRPFVTRCSLREAIQEANAAANSGGADLIKFSISGDGPHTIAPTSELPTITQPVIIDGYTQGDNTTSTTADDAVENTATTGTNAVLKIVLSGANAPSGSSNGVRGLVITGGGTTVRGLVINNFKLSNLGINGEGISVRSDNNVIEGNFVGTDANGTTDQGNQGIGILVASGKTGNTVGGTTPAARNLSSGNGFSGVEVDGSDNLVQGNLLGTDKNGTGDVGNSGRGVLIQGANNTVGGNNEATANTIAFNGLGVSVRGSTSTGNRILRNSIFSDDGFGSGLGIDLNEDGSTANDPKDTDTGPNNLQNKPTITSATTTGTSITVQGKLSSTPSKTFTLQFFSNPAGENEGKTFLAQRSVTTNANGNAPFTFSFGVAVPAGQTVTATATRLNSTSEFSGARTVVAQ